jgi:ribose 5-phosphate isomerase B
MLTTTVYIGADHAGFTLKEKIKTKLMQDGHEIYDLTPKFHEGDDYPAIARKIALHVKKDTMSRGVLVCGSGVGMTIGANRVKGTRAFDAYDETTTKLAREHTDANIIALSGWQFNASKAKKMLDLFFQTKFSNNERHHRRVKQLG